MKPRLLILFVIALIAMSCTKNTPNDNQGTKLENAQNGLTKSSAANAEDFEQAIELVQKSNVVLTPEFRKAISFANLDNAIEVGFYPKTNLDLANIWITGTAVSSNAESLDQKWLARRTGDKDVILVGLIDPKVHCGLLWLTNVQEKLVRMTQIGNFDSVPSFTTN